MNSASERDRVTAPLWVVVLCAMALVTGLVKALGVDGISKSTTPTLSTTAQEILAAIT